MNAASIMTAGVATLGPKNTVEDAVRLFFEQKIRQVPVVDEDGRVIGVITARILMRGALPGYITKGYLKDVRFAPELKEFGQKIEAMKNKELGQFIDNLKSASKQPTYAIVSPETCTMEIAAIFINPDVHTSIILVVDNQKRLLGVISPIDIFKNLWQSKTK